MTYTPEDVRELVDALREAHIALDHDGEYAGTPLCKKIKKVLAKHGKQ